MCAYVTVLSFVSRHTPPLASSRPLTPSQEKQWICDHGNCGKRFKLKEYLDVHKRTHIKLETSKQIL